MSEETLFQAIRSNDTNLAIKIFIRLNQRIDLIFDCDKNTLLHVSANSNNIELIEYLFNYYNTKIHDSTPNYDQFTKRKWINVKNRQGFSCIHFAVFRGNTKMAFLFEEQGSDIYAINNQGLTVLHIAAQGDSPVLMFYYLNKGFKISAVDSKGSTALHWACYSGQQNAVNALLAWGAEIDLQDTTYGRTPLHLAVMSGNGRIVRKLLIRGCDRNLISFIGKRALDVAKQNDYPNIEQMILDEQGIAELFNIKTPFRKMRSRTFPFYFLLVMFLINYVLGISFVLPTHFEEFMTMGIIFLILGFIVAVLFVIACNKQPGYLYQSEQINFFELLKKHHPSKICFDCQILKPQRSRHCQICQKCVSVYDHHCPWIANCIGAKNYCVFFLFLIMLWIFMAYSTAFEIVNLCFIDWSDLVPLEIIRIICVLNGLLCCAFFLLPLTFLIVVQIKNMLTNQTTFQRYAFSARPMTSRSSERTDSSLQASLLIKKSNNSETASMGNEESIRSNSTYLQGRKANYFSNCWKMCWNNSKNIRYTVGGLR